MNGAAGSESPQVIDFAVVRRQALTVVGSQVLLALLAGLLCLLARDGHFGLSALVGGLIGAAATLAQVLVGLRNASGRTPRQVVSGFYRGSAMKLVVTVLLFVIALRSRRFAPPPLFVTYVLSFLVYWLALARVITPKLGAAMAEQGQAKNPVAKNEE